MSASESTCHAAIDLGASGGRVAVGKVVDGKLDVEVVHTFPNGGVPVQGRLYWDHIGIWREILAGLRIAASRGITTIGVNSWGVDHVLMDRNGLILDGLRHYRDRRTEGVMEEALAKVGREKVYEGTGIQFMGINTAYQLLATKRDTPELLEQTERLLMVPDLMNHWLCGSVVSEVTDASTTQLLEPRSRQWNRSLIKNFGLPDIFGELAEPGTRLGDITPEVCATTGLCSGQVLAVGSHDTASAVAAVPAECGSGWAYVSSGTWSLVGLETDQPVISSESLTFDLTNEAAVGGKNRLLKNVMGLWLLQECRGAWDGTPFAELYAEAEATESEGAIIDPDDGRFLAAGHDMQTRIKSFCEETDQRPPESKGQITRCIMESLALKTATVIEALGAVSKQPVEVVHVVGGGSQIDFLNRLMTDACQRTLVAGPVEATLTGNLLVQAVSLGTVGAGEIREVVRRSYPLKTYRPTGSRLAERLPFAKQIFHRRKAS